jgi:parallel beta-helix repeat protein
LLIEGDRREAVLRLDEAIGRASEGAEIRLAPGEHRLARPLEIKKSLTLVGPGPDQCRVTCDGKGYVIYYMGDGTFAARGIRFEHVGSKPARVLLIASGQIDLENCVCRGAVWDGRNIGGDGLWATGSAQGTVRDCRFEQNGLHGLELDGNAALTLEGNTCQQNGQCGILFFGNSTGHVQNCRFEQNGVHGVQLSDNATLTLEGNASQQNGQCGIAFFGNSTGHVQNNVCRENGVAGIYVAGESQPTLEANRCEGNKQYGIVIWGNVTGNARKNICKNICIGNGLGAIFVAKTAKPELEENEGEVVYDN